MRSPREILEYLDAFYAKVIDRPSMYTPSASALENMIWFIEGLREFILNDPDATQRYDAFLDSLGYEAKGCAYLEGSDDSLSEEEEMLFRRVANVLQQFLVKEGRYVGKDA